MNQQQNQQEGVSFPPAKFQQGQKFPGPQFGLPQAPAPAAQNAVTSFGNIPQLSKQPQQFAPLSKPLQNTPLIPGQVQPPNPQLNNPVGKQMPFNPPAFGQNIQSFVQNPPNFQKPQVPTTFQKTDNNNNNNNNNINNKSTLPQAQIPSFTGMQNNNQFGLPNKFPQPMNLNIPVPQQKYEPYVVTCESDKMELVQNFTKYISEGNFNFAIECLKQIISNDIRVKIKDGSKNSN